MNLSGGSRVLLCCFLAIVKHTYGQMKPSNAVAEVGGEAIFNCSSTTVTPHWSMSKDGTSANLLTIASSCIVETSLQNHYKTEHIGGATSCNLIVFDVTMEQAGAYWCSEISISNVLLTVIDNSSVTSYNDTQGVVVENEKVIITCTLHHNGSVAPAPTLRPYFYWTNSIGQNVSSSYYLTTENTAVSQITVTAGRQDITGYTCHVYLKLNATIDPNYATNTPTVSNSVTNTPINVMYPIHVENITSEGRNSSSSCGISTVVCIGTANPAANYSWVDMEEPEKIIATNNHLYNFAESGRKYGCNATNSIKGDTYTDEDTYTVPDQYGITPCKISRPTNMNVTGETCSERKCGCLLDCNMTIHCHSDAYPEPSYSWKQAGITILENSTTLEDASNGIYICVAQNIIEGMPFEAELSVEVVNCRIYMIILIVMMVCLGCSTVATWCTVICYHSRGGFNHLIDRIFPFPSSKKTVGDTVSVGATDSIGRPGSSVPSEGSGLPGSTGPKHHLENDDKSCLRILWTVLFVFSSCVASGIVMAVIACCCLKDKKDQHKQPLWLFILIQLSFFVVVICLWIVGGVGISPCVF